jgi:hypothetical protein
VGFSIISRGVRIGEFLLIFLLAWASAYTLGVVVARRTFERKIMFLVHIDVGYVCTGTIFVYSQSAYHSFTAENAGDH